MKYFMVGSFLFVEERFSVWFMMTQNDRVFISNAIQMIIHEFLIRHMMAEANIVVVISGKNAIFLVYLANVKLQVWRIIR